MDYNMNFINFKQKNTLQVEQNLNDGNNLNNGIYNDLVISNEGDGPIGILFFYNIYFTQILKSLTII